MALKRADYLRLAEDGLCMPIGTDLVLHEHDDVDAVLHDGRCLGGVVTKAARRFHTPLAFPLMDLTIEKAALLQALGVDAADVAKFHFAEPPDESTVARLRQALPTLHHPRLQATCDAIAFVAKEVDLEPVGMVIGPLSLLVKLLPDAIMDLYMAGQLGLDDESAQVRGVRCTLEICVLVVIESVKRQIAAGAKAVVVCEPAASTAFLSPRQLSAGVPLLEMFVAEPNQRVVDVLRQSDCELIFHCCGELTPEFIKVFGELRPVILSLGSSRVLWEDAALLAKDIILFGNLPSKAFYSDEACPVDAVVEQARELVTRMGQAGHPFILGTECDVLDVPDARGRIWKKVDALMAAKV